MIKFNGVWIPHKEPPDPDIAKNRKLYESDPELKKLADYIHNSRMLSPPACDDCIQIAINRLANANQTANL